MTLYRVRIGISHVAGKLVPETRLVNLTEAEALYDLSLDRIVLEAPLKPAKPAKASADGGD